MTKEICPICGEMAAQQNTKEVTYTYKNHSFEIKQPALWCEACGEGIISPIDNKAVALEMQAHRAQIDGLLEPNQIKKIRKHLKFNQKDAGLFFGGGVNAFTRYENGYNPIPKPLSMLLSLLDKHPEQLKELKSNKAYNTKDSIAN
jgi:HTH-type transcriptional regulator/antitoxin MqsA